LVRTSIYVTLTMKSCSKQVVGMSVIHPNYGWKWSALSAFRSGWLSCTVHLFVTAAKTFCNKSRPGEVGEPVASCTSKETWDVWFITLFPASNPQEL
jgi:hypothetical protein